MAGFFEQVKSRVFNLTRSKNHERIKFSEAKILEVLQEQEQGKLMPSSELLTLMLFRMPRDGFIETGKRRNLERTFATQYWLQVDQASTFDLLCNGLVGKEIRVTLDGVKNADRISARNGNPVNAAALKILDGPKTSSTGHNCQSGSL